MWHSIWLAVRSILLILFWGVFLLLPLILLFALPESITTTDTFYDVAVTLFLVTLLICTFAAAVMFVIHYDVRNVSTFQKIRDSLWRAAFYVIYCVLFYIALFFLMTFVDYLQGREPWYERSASTARPIG